MCDSTFIEDILKHELQFTQLQIQMNLDNIQKRKAVYEATLSPSLMTSWRQACTQAPVNANFNRMNLVQFSEAREQFVLKVSDCTRSLAEDTRHWMLYDLKKPRNMSVHDFQKRVNEICEYFPYMPRPRETIPVTTCINPPDENDKIVILHNACPKSWCDEQARTNQPNLDLQQLITYYSTLKSIEKNKDGEKEEKQRGGKHRKKGKDYKNKHKDKEDDPICPIHGGHTISQCKYIKDEREKFQEKKRNRKNNQGNKNKKGDYNNDDSRNSRHRYHEHRNRNNNYKKNSSDERVRFREENNEVASRSRQDNDVDSTGSFSEEDDHEEMNTIYEQMNTISDSEVHPTEGEIDDLATETRIRIISSTKKRVLNCLIDSGASDTHIKRKALKNVQYKSSKG